MVVAASYFNIAQVHLVSSNLLLFICNILGPGFRREVRAAARDGLVLLCNKQSHRKLIKRKIHG
jgi:hypothetical protein